MDLFERRRRFENICRCFRSVCTTFVDFVDILRSFVECLDVLRTFADALKCFQVLRNVLKTILGRQGRV